MLFLKCCSRKKSDYKFKKAGPGQKLGEESQAPRQTGRQPGQLINYIEKMKVKYNFSAATTSARPISSAGSGRGRSLGTYRTR